MTLNHAQKKLNPIVRGGGGSNETIIEIINWCKLTFNLCSTHSAEHLDEGPHSRGWRRNVSFTAVSSEHMAATTLIRLCSSFTF